LFVDPSRGQILSLLTQKATLSERYHQGQTVGYAITFVLFLGFAIAIYKLVTLTAVGGAIRRQLKDPQNPSDKNPLGRILKVYHENPNTDIANLELKLDEAILRETPSIDSGVNIIKILAAIAPLMGLLGTVVGMIGTFQSITLFGTGDPRIMAGDISMALVTTALGLIAALPLIVIHSIVASKSKSILHILDEQSAGIVATHAEKKGA
jgi:biopolymer transport protein ExbB